MMARPDRLSFRRGLVVAIELPLAPSLVVMLRRLLVMHCGLMLRTAIGAFMTTALGSSLVAIMLFPMTRLDGAAMVRLLARDLLGCMMVARPAAVLGCCIGPAAAVMMRSFLVPLPGFGGARHRHVAARRG